MRIGNNALVRRSPLLTGCLLLALTGCAGTSTPTESAPRSPAAASPTTPSGSTGAPSPTAAAVDQTIRISYAGGKVSGVGSLVKVALNSRVALVVTSDVADEVHLHGYDKSADVAGGGTVTVLFEATLPGRFEVELEKLRRRLVVLQVQ